MTFLRFLLALTLVISLPFAPARANDFLEPELAFAPTVAMVDPLTVDAHYTIAPDYYMYRERFEVRVENSQGELLLFLRSALTPPEAETRTPLWLEQAMLPRGKVVFDPVFEQDMEVYHQGVTLRIPLQPGAAAPLQLSITGQGCSDTGLCYPPMTQELVLLPADGGYVAQGPQVVDWVPAPQDAPAAAGASPATGPDGPAPQSSASASNAGNWADIIQPGGIDRLGDQGMAAWLHAAALWQILLLSLLFGVLLSFTPCVLPMVPILLAVIAGQDGHAVSRSRGLWLAAIYVLGMSLVYTVLGVTAGLIGAGMAAWLQSPWVIGSFAVLLALFALAMLGLFTMQAPVSFQTALQTHLQKLPGGQSGGVFFMGMLSALIVGPCVAAPLAGVLLFISQTGDVVIGGSALFAMAWGEGLLLLAVGAGAGAFMPRAGAWMNTLKDSFGLLLLATALWMARPLLPGSLYAGSWVLLALWAAMLLWQAGRGAQGSTDAAGGNVFHLLVRALAIMLALWGLAQGAGLLAGGRDMLRPLAPFAATAPGSQAAQPGLPADPETIRAMFDPVTSLAELESRLAGTTRPVMLDFYADWCVSCIEMEKFTFTDPRVFAAMNNMLLLQADVTRMNDDDKALLSRFDLFGPPGIMFFDAAGKYIPDARVIGYRKADSFIKVLEQVLGSAGQ